MVNISSIQYAGGACPYQIEATTDTGKYFYLRYRGGMLSYGVWDSHSAQDGKYKFRKEIGDIYDGWAEHDVISRELNGLVKFPEGFKHDFDSVIDYQQEKIPIQKYEADAIETLRVFFDGENSAKPHSPIISK